MVRYGERMGGGVGVLKLFSLYLGALRGHRVVFYSAGLFKSGRSEVYCGCGLGESCLFVHTTCTNCV